jgi:hypothetical protein
MDSTCAGLAATTAYSAATKKALSKINNGTNDSDRVRGIVEGH